MDSAIEDEILSLNAIYGEHTLEIISREPILCSLTLPGEFAVALRVEFPADYPDAPPSILGTQGVGDNIQKGRGQHVVGASRTILSEVYQPGSPCLFDLVEELQAQLPELLPTASSRPEDPQSIGRNGQRSLSDSIHSNEPDVPQPPPPSTGKQPPWFVSDVLTEKKSIFVARAAAVQSPLEAKSYLQHLLATDKKVAKATHNITAWRIQGPNETTYQDCDDDGETAAGGRLLHLMQLMDIWDVMVVVTRWYGGVQLGPDRFRLINTAARDAFVKGAFLKEDGKVQKGQKGHKK